MSDHQRWHIFVSLTEILFVCDVSSGVSVLAILAISKNDRADQFYLDWAAGVTRLGIHGDHCEPCGGRSSRVVTNFKKQPLHILKREIMGWGRTRLELGLGLGLGETHSEWEGRRPWVGGVSRECCKWFTLSHFILRSRTWALCLFLTRKIMTIFIYSLYFSMLLKCSIKVL